MALGIQVVFDCADPASLAGFWAEALGYVVQPPPPGYGSWDVFLREQGMAEEDLDRASAIVDPDGHGPRVHFQRVPEGKVAKNRVHLDVRASAGARGEDGRRAARETAEHLKTLGATERYEMEELGVFWITMQDPEGNEFCVT
jgi:hypothetical protein